MRAWRVHRLGEPLEALTWEDGPSLDAGAGELVVEVGACGLNFSDVLLCRGEYQEKPALPFTPGTEVVGTVIASGVAGGVASGGTAVGIGSRVLGRSLLPDGGLADQARLRADRVLPVPDTLSDAEAAALHVTYQTAWFGLHQRAQLRPGETLLVTAGAGGTGSAAIQLGVAAGARVLATAGGADKAAVCHDLGAELVIDHRADDVVSAIRDATQGEGVDVAFDTVGGDLFDQVRRCIAFEGRLVVVGFASGRIPDLPANHLMVKNYAVLGLHWPGYERHRPDLVRRAHDSIVDLHRRGHVRPLVGEVHPLADAPDALTRLATGRTTGKVVVCP